MPHFLVIFAGDQFIQQPGVPADLGWSWRQPLSSKQWQESQDTIQDEHSPQLAKVCMMLLLASQDRFKNFERLATVFRHFERLNVMFKHVNVFY